MRWAHWEGILFSQVCQCFEIWIGDVLCLRKSPMKFCFKYFLSIPSLNWMFFNFIMQNTLKNYFWDTHYHFDFGISSIKYFTNCLVFLNNYANGQSLYCTVHAISKCKELYYFILQTFISHFGTNFLQLFFYCMEFSCFCRLATFINKNFFWYQFLEVQFLSVFWSNNLTDIVFLTINELKHNKSLTNTIYHHTHFI